MPDLFVSCHCFPDSICQHFVDIFTDAAECFEIHSDEYVDLLSLARLFRSPHLLVMNESTAKELGFFRSLRNG